LTNAIGIIAAVLTTGCWVPQLVKTVRLRHAEDFAWPYLGLLAIGLAAWLVYGILRSDPPIYVANALTVLSVLAVMVVKARSRPHGIELDQAEGSL
jgi:MtN3 and saliva related transmembrane protein